MRINAPGAGFKSRSDSISKADLFRRVDAMTLQREPFVFAGENKFFFFMKQYIRLFYKRAKARKYRIFFIQVSRRSHRVINYKARLERTPRSPKENLQQLS